VKQAVPETTREVCTLASFWFVGHLDMSLLFLVEVLALHKARDERRSPNWYKILIFIHQILQIQSTNK